jgi:hypothetical protein
MHTRHIPIPAALEQRFAEIGRRAPDPHGDELQKMAEAALRQAAPVNVEQALRGPEEPK